MSRSRWHPSRCNACGITNRETKISASGLCRPCGDRIRDANIAQLELGDGPFYDHWLNRSYLSMRRRLVAREAKQATG